MPIAAFPVHGPLDIVGANGFGMNGGTKPIGALDEDLARAITLALEADRDAAVAEVRHYSWQRCTDRSLSGLAVADPRERLRQAA